MKRQPFLLAYDVSDPRRLARMHRLLRKWGQAVQFSVFQLSLDQSEQERLMSLVARIADPKADDVRLYRLPVRRHGNGKLDGMYVGKTAAGEGIHLIGDPGTAPHK